ncbi:MAG: PAS domain-containing protein [Desulfonatronovibrio sp.]|nr:PAS domain-containing protein [Desulfovibrionales bacterium]
MPLPSKKKNQSDQSSFADSRDILINAPIGIFTSTPEGRYISANPALAKLYGYDSPEELMKSVTDIAGQVYVNPQERKEFIRIMKEHGEVINHECRRLSRDGTIFWVSISSRSVIDEDGQVVAFQGFTTDITSSKQAQHEKEKAEQRFRLMFVNAPLPYQSLDEQGQFIDVNQKFLDVLGYTREELIGKNFSDILHPDWRDHFKENFPRFKAVGEILGVEFEMVKKKGSTILVYFNGKIQRDDQNKFLRTYCIFHDITKERRTEEYLKQVLESTDDSIWDYDLATDLFDNCR